MFIKIFNVQVITNKNLGRGQKILTKVFLIYILNSSNWIVYISYDIDKRSKCQNDWAQVLLVLLTDIKFKKSHWILCLAKYKGVYINCVQLGIYALLLACLKLAECQSWKPPFIPGLIKSINSSPWEWSLLEWF